MIYDPNDGVKTFSFSYGEEDSQAGADFPISTSMNATFRYDSGCTWDVVLKDFVRFLGSAWGYDISDKVSYETLLDRLHRTNVYGGTFDDDATTEADKAE